MSFRCNMAAVLQVQLLKNEAKLPARSSPMSAGLDVYSIAPVILKPGERTKVPLGIALSPPTGTYIRIAPRSGLTLQGVDVLAGVIDADYCGEVIVVLVNNKEDVIRFESGSRIAQIICEKIIYPEIVAVDHVQATLRGAGNFGSTGLIDSSHGFEQQENN